MNHHDAGAVLIIAILVYNLYDRYCTYQENKLGVKKEKADSANGENPPGAGDCFAKDG